MPQRVAKVNYTNWLAVIAILSNYAPLLSAADPPPGASEFFEMRIRPLLVKRCFTCHTTAHMGGLEMNGRNSLLKGGDRGPAISPDHPEDSLLLKAVAYKLEALKMPPAGKLPDNEIEDLAVWVKAGAVWPESPTPAAPKGPAYTITPEQRAFWAFRPVRTPALPSVADARWSKSAIDRLVQAKREAQGLEPNKPADKLTLLRRAYFDLIGLPPTPEQADAFLQDSSPGAFAKVVDGLLASPRYGERWGRYWLDVARYSDDKLDSEEEVPYPNAFRYRDWVINAFNTDMPYNQFVKAQIAGDLLGDNDKYAPGLGFYALRPKADMQEDRVDATTRGFLGLTVGCAECHNHKFDPIPTTDYYSLLGVFTSTEDSEFHLAPEPVVKEYKDQEKKVKDQEARIRDFLYAQATQLGEILADETPRYLRAARKVLGPAKMDALSAAEAAHLDRETLERWVRYLQVEPKDHRYLDNWQDEKFDPEKFRQSVLAVLKERKTVDDSNAVARAEAKKEGPKAQPKLVSLKTESYYLWRDLFFNDFYGNQFKQEDDGILYYGPNRGYLTSDGTVERFLSGPWKGHLDSMRAELAALRQALPAPYPFAHTIKDAEKPKVERVRIGGNQENLGDSVPHHFLSILSDGEPHPFEKGSGRLELAEAIADERNPMTARVMANRIWQRHFGAGIVRTPSDFGRMGDRPANPELLDYLASTFIASGWSMKALHREIMLSATYALSADQSAKNMRIDPENRMLWRANIQRLDAETLRDSLLFICGELDLKSGGPPDQLGDEKNKRRTVYGFVSRNKLDGMLALFDFQNPNITSEKRNMTESPAQELFFLNSSFIGERAQALARRVGASPKPIDGAYRILFNRAPTPEELRLGESFLKGSQSNDWQRYAQALLNSNEFLFVN
jgi:hypothetical protein